ncbi:Uma2 family endonuclease [Candidatus Thiosymbion oneisti]|uniref:Uma2 family endonuclease n=1 Tax=Candidatus Thiosymbion oneisti TaxID=589554 RepID=UPI000AD77AF7|nr:Uma2 family endonuclease [Candidatus Thiosymbion oneisti]
MLQPAPAHRPTLYEALEALPEGVTGEILNGQLHTQPRPAISHAHVALNLAIGIGGPYGKGIGGPGGWWIFPEPEVHFGRDVEVAVPDLAGWRRERMPILPTGHRVEVVPDWVCEILSLSTERKDRQDKMPLYARYGVRYAWLTDPVKHMLEVYQLEAGAWVEIGRFAEAGQVTAPPFEAVSIVLEDLWLPQQLRLVER